ncbi:MAG: hypothetical protein GY754_14155 [bacterium]|nr:hypothetical protein [bacterium]
MVRSVDEKGNKSFSSDLVHTKEINFHVNLRGSYLVPIGDFGDLNGPGGGTLVDAHLENVFIRNLLFGVSTGFLYFSGELTGMEYSYNIPIMAKVGYRFTLFDIVDIVPEIAAGISYNKVFYSNEGMIGVPGYSSSAESDAFQPIIMASVLVSYNIRDDLLIGGGIDFGSIIENDGMMMFFGFNLCASYKFFGF